MSSELSTCHETINNLRNENARLIAKVDSNGCDDSISNLRDDNASLLTKIEKLNATLASLRIENEKLIAKSKELDVCNASISDLRDKNDIYVLRLLNLILANPIHLPLSMLLDVAYLVEALDFTFFVILCHEALVADVVEEETLVDGDVCGVLFGGVGGALIGVPLPANMGIIALLLVVSLLLLLLSPLVVAPVTITRHRTFCNKMTGLTTFVARPLGAGFVILHLSLLEDFMFFVLMGSHKHLKPFPCRRILCKL